VLRAIRKHSPAESTVYLGDTARVPYGPKSPETVRRYVHEAARFLVERGVKALVIACNTATAHAWSSLSESLDVPVIGVVRPGAAEAVEATRSGIIGVIGTQGTIDSGTYERAIHAVRRGDWAEERRRRIQAVARGHSVRGRQRAPELHHDLRRQAHRLPRDR